MSDLYEKLYDSNEATELHEKIADVEQAETAFRGLLDRIMLIDPELAFEADGIIGIISRAYSKQGFNLGMNVARSMECC